MKRRSALAGRQGCKVVADAQSRSATIARRVEEENRPLLDSGSAGDYPPFGESRRGFV